MEGLEDRATQAARDAAAERLSAAYVAGALSTDTFEARVAEVLAARHASQIDRALGVQADLILRQGEDSVIVGRSSACEHTLDDATVSRRHALLRQMPTGAWRLVDLASTNGTSINGRRIKRAAVLSDGDEIGLGRVRLRVRLPT